MEKYIVEKDGYFYIKKIISITMSNICFVMEPIFLQNDDLSYNIKKEDIEDINKNIYFICHKIEPDIKMIQNKSVESIIKNGQTIDASDRIIKYFCNINEWQNEKLYISDECNTYLYYIKGATIEYIDIEKKDIDDIIMDTIVNKYLHILNMNNIYNNKN